MYALLAFTYKADQNSQEVVKKCLDFLGKEYKLYNIPNHRVGDLLVDHTVVVTFGKFAELAVQHHLSEKKFTDVRHEKLPHPKQLIKIEINKDFRSAALQTLTTLKDFLAQDLYKPEVKKISEADMPDLDHRQLLMLEKIVEESKKGSCFQTTKDGKLIEIGASHRADSKADIQLTFEEIYSLRLAMDVLGTTEVELVATSPPGCDSIPAKKIA